jgi:hypothetical protein
MSIRLSGVKAIEVGLCTEVTRLSLNPFGTAAAAGFMSNKSTETPASRTRTIRDQPRLSIQNPSFSELDCSIQPSLLYSGRLSESLENNFSAARAPYFPLQTGSTLEARPKKPERCRHERYSTSGYPGYQDPSFS